MQLRVKDQFLGLKDVPNDFLLQHNKHSVAVTEPEDELENVNNKGSIPIANVDTPRTADMTKIIIAIF
jgi:hypothetical protein